MWPGRPKVGIRFQTEMGGGGSSEQSDKVGHRPYAHGRGCPDTAQNPIG